MRPIEETLVILNFENYLKRINAFKVMTNMKATTSDHMLNIKQNNNPLYQILQPIQDQIRSARTYTEDVLIGVKGLYV